MATHKIFAIKAYDIYKLEYSNNHDKLNSPVSFSEFLNNEWSNSDIRSKYISKISKSIEKSEGICPVCGEPTLNHDEIEFVNVRIAYPWFCTNCGSTGDELYNLVFEKHYNITDSDFEELDLEYDDEILNTVQENSAIDYELVLSYDDFSVFKVGNRYFNYACETLIELVLIDKEEIFNDTSEEYLLSKHTGFSSITGEHICLPYYYWFKDKK